MRTFAILLTAAALFTSNGAYAQTNMGNAAQQGTFAVNHFAWGIGLASLVVIGVVVGVTAGAASSTSSTFSH